MKNLEKNKNILKLSAVLLASAISLSLLTACQSKNKETKKTIKIGISQIVEHPALDEAREGIIEELKNNGFVEGKNLEIDFQNAQGNIPTTQTIATKFVNDKKDLIFAIATPSAQSAKNATSDIPIVFTAVTDPVDAKLVTSNKKPDGNVTGTSDFQGSDKALETIKLILPDVKKIGIVFNTSEVNSKLQVDDMIKEAKKSGIEVISSGVSNTNEISQAVSSISKQVDVIFTPTDNLIASAMPLVTETALKNNIPVIGAEEAHVKSGALASNSINYKEIGKQAGKQAIKILNGEKISNIPVEFAKGSKVVMNKQTMEKLKIKLKDTSNIEFIK